jgi:cobalt-zinc-cadmium efflux system protein
MAGTHFDNLHHDHAGHHHHAVSVEQAGNKAFQLGILLNLIYVVAELISGFLTDSLALITDAGHNFSDVISLALSLLAFRLARVKPTEKFTYGFKKTTILAALVNAVILLIAIGILSFESIERLRHPAPVEGGVVALIALAGIIINAVSAMLFYKTQKGELNARGAYLHLMADALVSAGVVVAGIVIKYTGWNWLDPVVSLIILVVILVSTWQLLTESVQLSLDAVPKEIDLHKVEEIIKKNNGVEGVHHIHVWAISTTQNALTAHIIIEQSLNEEQRSRLKTDIKHELLHYNIHHATLELEVKGGCKEPDCQPS